MIGNAFHGDLSISFFSVNFLSSLSSKLKFLTNFNSFVIVVITLEYTSQLQQRQSRPEGGRKALDLEI